MKPSAFALAAAIALAACDGPPPGDPPNMPAADARAERLQGTWLREVTEDGTRARRILELKPDGTFIESVHVVEPSGAVRDFRHEGAWFFDGTNLKRRYTLMDGQPPSRVRLPFATFEIAFDSRDAFTGIDRVHGHRIRYDRVPDDTRP